MYNKPLISVLIPAYNHQNYVQKTIQSIIGQTYPNIELIVIDDGSKDLTWQKIQEMRELCTARFTRVHFETKPNEGTCDTLNKLLNYAKGEYIYFIASDDLAKPQALEKEFNFLSNNPAYALCVGDNEIIDGRGTPCFWDKNRDNVYEDSKARYKTFVDFLKQERPDIDFNSSAFGTYRSLYNGNYIPNGFLIKSCVFENLRYTKKAPLEDYYLMLQISKKYKMKYLDEILFSYRWHGSNTINQTNKMNDFSKKTKDYEEEILRNIPDSSAFFPDVIEIKHKGLLYKTQGIPYIFQILSYRKGNGKIKIIKLFHFTIAKCHKNI